MSADDRFWHLSTVRRAATLRWRLGANRTCKWLFGATISALMTHSGPQATINLAVQ
jgi:hypothetical protein